MIPHGLAWHLSADCPARPRRVASDGESRRDSPIPGSEAGRVSGNQRIVRRKNSVVSRERNTRRVRCEVTSDLSCVWIMNFKDFRYFQWSGDYENDPKIVTKGSVSRGNMLREWLPLRGLGIKRKFQNHLNSSKKYFENKLNSPRKSNILKKSQKLSFYTFCPSLIDMITLREIFESYFSRRRQVENIET